MGPAQPVLLPDAAVASANHYSFDLEQPYAELPENVQQAILHGSGKQKIPFLYVGEKGNKARTRTRLRRRPAQSRAPVSRDGFRGRARRACEISQHPAVSGMQRDKAAAGSALRHRHRQGDLRSLRAASDRFHRILRAPRPARSEAGDRREDRARDRESAAVPGECRTGLSVARSLHGHALGWRGAAHPSCEPDRIGTDRRHVRPGRTVHRLAPARQFAAAANAEAPARHRQFGHRRRARRRSDLECRLRGRHGARRGRSRRTRRRTWHAARNPRTCGIADRTVP